MHKSTKDTHFSVSRWEEIPFNDWLKAVVSGHAHESLALLSTIVKNFRALELRISRLYQPI